MKTIHTLVFLILISVLVQPGCNNCRLVECAEDAQQIELKLTRDGKNAVFGPDAFIDRDSLVIQSSDPTIVVYSIVYNENAQSVVLYLKDRTSYTLEIENLTTLTLMIHNDFVEMGECCPINELTAVLLNGQIICTEDCTEVLVVEI